MSKISFEDIGAVVATCQTEQGVQGGQVVKLSGNGIVAPCSAGEAFCGVAMEPRTGLTGVQFKGFMTVSCTGVLNVGWATLAADGAGGVKSAASGVSAQVICVNTDGTAVICL